jgi:hypothetical protein
LNGGRNLGDRWSRIWARRQPQPMQPSFSVHERVGAELSCVAEWLAQSVAISHETDVHRNRPARPDLSERSSTRPEQPVQLAVDVGEQWEIDAEMFGEGSQPRWVVGESDDHRLGIPQIVDVLAHGTHVLLARQSSEMPVQN